MCGIQACFACVCVGGVTFYDESICYCWIDVVHCILTELFAITGVFQMRTIGHLGVCDPPHLKRPGVKHSGAVNGGDHAVDSSLDC